jgi:hypothetical protein
MATRSADPKGRHGIAATVRSWSRIINNPIKARRAGTLLAQILLVIFNFISIQELEEFIFEGSLDVMMRLIVDVFDHSPFVRLANAECAITFLPRETSSLWKGLMRPPGRVRLHNIHEIRN